MLVNPEPLIRLVRRDVDPVARTRDFEGCKLLNRSRANQFLLGMFLTLYGVITLSGPALHAFPGFGHGSAALSSEQGAVPGHGERENTAVHDCPICHFHAQAQPAVDADCGPCPEAVEL